MLPAPRLCLQQCASPLFNAKWPHDPGMSACACAAGPLLPSWTRVLAAALSISSPGRPHRAHGSSARAPARSSVMAAANRLSEFLPPSRTLQSSKPHGEIQQRQEGWARSSRLLPVFAPSPVRGIRRPEAKTVGKQSVQGHAACLLITARPRGGGIPGLPPPPDPATATSLPLPVR